jgi:hypothetical protein
MKHHIIKLQAPNEHKPSSYSSDKWVKYGDDNLFPQKVLDLYKNSPTHQAISNYKAQLIAGEGFILDSPEKIALNERYKLNDLLHKLAIDFSLFGGFSLACGWNRGQTGLDIIEHLDLTYCRAGYMPKKAEIGNYFISEDWSKINYTDYKPISYPSFNPKEKQPKKVEVYYFKKYTPSMKYYPLPDYIGGLGYIELEYELSKFHLNNVKRGFTPSAIITVPFDATNEEKEAFQSDMESNFVGTANAGKFIVLYGQTNGEKLEVTPLNINNNENLYRELNDITQQKIITAHRLTSPTLVGLAGAGGLGGNASEIEMATEYFYSQTIRGMQVELENQINYLMTFSGVQLATPLVIDNFKIFVNKVVEEEKEVLPNE